MIGGRVVRSMDTAATTTAGSQHQRRKKQQQQQLQRRRATTVAASQHHQHHHHQHQQQQQPGGRRRAMPVRRTCPTVTGGGETEMTTEARAWQPSRQHSIVKRPSRVYRELCLAWNSRVGSQNTNAPAHRVQALFNDLGLYPTSAQVAEMMQCVMKCANRSSPVYMTFGEFCLLAKKLKNGLDRGIPRSVQFSRLLEKDQEKHLRLGVNKKNSITSRRVLHHADAADTTQHHSTYDVFLGGSCNPTTWRKDLAVPYLQEAGVSFYNPQVDHWSQELIEIEHAAKENATILFFVIDSQTRNVVTDIETANFAGYHGNNLVLVIHPQDVVTGSVIAGEHVSAEEAEDIKEALAVLHDITSLEGVLVFDNIPLALSKIVQILKEKNNHQNMTDNTGEENTTTYRKIRDAFNMFDTNASGKINIVDVRMAVRLLADQNLSENEVLALMSEPGGNSNGMAAEDHSNDRVCTFDQFYAIASKYYLQRSADKRDCRNGGCDTGGRTTYRPNVGGRSPPLCSAQERGVVETTRSPKTTDIYLAGESGDDIRWAEDIAIPMIKKSNLTYHAAARTDLSVLLDARTMLFVIPNNSRSLATMTMAAYCLAKSSGRMVLCIQNLSNNDSVVRGEKLTQTAINDYNRGRMYLADLAARERVPVFESITEAVELAIQKSL